MLLMNILFFLIMYFSIKGIYYISIRDRMREFGVLRAIGIENRTLYGNIIGDILYQSLLPALTGIIIGGLLSFLFRNTIKSLYSLDSFEIVLDYHIILVMIPVILAWLALSLDNYRKIRRGTITSLLNFENEDTENKSPRIRSIPTRNLISKIPLNNLLKNKYKTLFMTLSLGIISSILIGSMSNNVGDNLNQ